MSHIHLDLDVLRSFSTGVAMGSFAQAADKLGRSTSAVSAQLKKLESQAGTALLRKAGRGLELTEAGHAMLAYAHRLLELNDEAVAAIRASDLQGVVRLGLPEDFGERVLPAVLGRFTRAHPRVQIQVSSGTSAQLLSQYEDGLLDLSVAWDLSTGTDIPSGTRVLTTLPLRWIGPASGQGVDMREQPWWSLVGDTAPSAALTDKDDQQPWRALPLVMLAEPCPLRGVVTQALNRHGLPWRNAFSSASLAASWSAVASGLGLAVRTSFGLPPHVRLIGSDEAPGLPVLPNMRLLLKTQSQQPQVLQLSQLLEQALNEAAQMD
ncbi:LysR family transcriptional regulator [Diaphorobacter sp. HDW4B]|uniref:LysR substrate-binding domain-containing protein n=1 Tax=Diaphorobacter sp. HDW4B TaxID=2714925 RepID=UPI00140DFE4D|nr:LysR substrate-binding domain-containing protein [Diaphorobacter sp. HDW4B]QIL70254.1 LysR family transcriptional regulator [Diaphorobacter sp. HDW4B]